MADEHLFCSQVPTCSTSYPVPTRTLLPESPVIFPVRVPVGLHLPTTTEPLAKLCLKPVFCKLIYIFLPTLSTMVRWL